MTRTEKIRADYWATREAGLSASRSSFGASFSARGYDQYVAEMMSNADIGAPSPADWLRFARRLSAELRA